MGAFLATWWGGYMLGAVLAYVTTAVFFILYWHFLPWQDDD